MVLSSATTKKKQASKEAEETRSVIAEERKPENLPKKIRMKKSRTEAMEADPFWSVLRARHASLGLCRKFQFRPLPGIRPSRDKGTADASVRLRGLLELDARTAATS